MTTKKNYMAELRTTMQNKNLPHIDVTDKVMDAITHKQSNNRRVWPILSMVAIFILACGFGYATASWKLLKDDGSVAMEYRTFTNDHQPSYFPDHMREEIPVGEARIFYNKETGISTSIANEIEYTQYDEFSSIGGGYFHSPAALSSDNGSYLFKSGKFIHMIEPPQPQLMEELRENAQQTNEAYVTANVPLGKMMGYSATYENELEKSIILNAIDGERWKTIYTDKIKNMKETVKLISNTEAVHIVDSEQSFSRLEWMGGSETNPIYYRLHTNLEQGASIETLIEIANGIETGSLIK